jgi:hypothetical protein
LSIDQQSHSVVLLLSKTVKSDRKGRELVGESQFARIYKRSLKLEIITEIISVTEINRRLTVGLRLVDLLVDY